jgi:hypothetical protein
MSGPYENVRLLDDVCRAVMREKETATGCLLVVFYGDLAEVITAERDMTGDLGGVAAKLRKAAEKVEEIHAADQERK